MLSRAGNADFSAHTHAQRLGGNLVERLTRSAGHAALLQVGISNHLLALGSNHRAFHNPHNPRQKIAAKIRSGADNPLLAQGLPPALFLITALRHAQLNRSPGHVAASRSGLIIHSGFALLRPVIWNIIACTALLA